MQGIVAARKQVFAAALIGGSDCIFLPGYRSPEGYSVWALDGKQAYAHRAVFLLSGQIIPDGFQIDHTCHNPITCPAPGPRCPHRACINIDHLEAVSPQENTRRGSGGRDRCPRGHLYTEENTYIRPSSGTRHCNICRKECDDKRNAESKQHRAEERALRVLPPRRTVYPGTECLNCGVLFSGVPYMRRAERKTCSDECAAAHLGWPVWRHSRTPGDV